MAPPTIAQKFGYFATIFCAAFVLVPLFSPIFGPRLSSPHSRYQSTLSFHGGSETESTTLVNEVPLYGSKSPWAADPLRTNADDSTIPRQCRLSKEHLAELKLSDSFTYDCRQIRAIPQRSKQTVLPVPVEEQLYSLNDKYQLSRVANTGISTKITADPIKLITTVESQSSDGSSFVFGVATDADRLLARTSKLQHSLGNTNATLVAILSDKEQNRVEEIKTVMHNVGVRIKLFTSSDDFLARYMGMTEAFGKIREPHHRWFIYTDDDTLFLSFTRLSKMLSKYDPRDPYYIGSITEDFRMTSAVRFIAFGGAGVIVSSGLMDELVPLYPKCRELGGPGDYRLAHCIYENTLTKLTLEFSLRQADLLDDPVGVFESGRVLTSVHHWDSTWFKYDVDTMLSSSWACSTGCIMERFRFISPHKGRSRAILSNGVSIVEYPDDLDVDFKRMELTWRTEPGSNYDHALGPLRDKLEEGKQRFTYHIQKAWTEADSVHQVFVRRDPTGDEVIHLMWI